MNKRLFIFLAGLTILRLFLAGVPELGNDEVYYLSYAEKLQENYFDHPPVIAWMIRITTINGYFHADFFYRIGPVFCSVVNSLLVFRIALKLFNARSAWFAVCLYNFSLYGGILCGLLLLPDAPEMLFWLAAVSLITDIYAGRDQGWRWIALGITVGLCIMSKVSGLFLWFGFAGYLFFKKRETFKSRWIYISVFLTLVIASPIYLWNVSNHFVTWSYHSGRVGLFTTKPQVDSFLQCFFGSVLYNNPVNVVLIVLALIRIRKKNVAGAAVTPLFLWLSLPVIIAVTLMSVFNDTLPHWSGPGFTTLLFLAAPALDQAVSRLYPKSLVLAAGLFALSIGGGLIYFYFLPLAFHADDQKKLGKGDIGLDMTGWREFGSSFRALYEADQSAGRMKPNPVILSDYWFPAAHLDHYVAKPNHLSVLAAGPVNDIHQFAWLNALRLANRPIDDAYFIYPSNYYGPLPDRLRACFDKVDDSVLVDQYRQKVNVRNFVVYRLHGANRKALLEQVPEIR